MCQLFLGKEILPWDGILVTDIAVATTDEKQCITNVLIRQNFTTNFDICGSVKEERKR